MNRPIQHSLTLITLCTSLSYANFSVQVNVGLSDTSHETKAYVLRNYNEVALFEIWQDYRNLHPYEEVVITAESTAGRKDFDTGANSNYMNHPAGEEKPLDNFFFLGSNEGQEWEGSTSNVHLLTYDNTPNNDGYYEIRITDNILTFSGTTPGANDVFVSLLENSVGDYEPKEYVFANIIAQGAYQFTAPEDLSIYTTHKAIQPPIEGGNRIEGYDQLADYDPIYFGNLFAKFAGVALISTEDYAEMLVYKDNLFEALDRSGYYLNGQYHYNTIDAGISMTYDFDVLRLNVDAMAHYPLEVGTRESVDIIQYSPSTQFDGALGISVGFSNGSIGATLGFSQLNGDILLTKMQRTNNSGNLENIAEIEYTNSYTLGDDNRNITDLKENLYFGEFIAKSKPVNANGVSLYAKYRLGLNPNDNNRLQQLKLEADSISFGALFQVY